MADEQVRTQSSAQGVKQLHLEIKNAEENSIQDMKATIPQVNIKTIKKDENKFNINLEYKSGTDPRKIYLIIR